MCWRRVDDGGYTTCPFATGVSAGGRDGSRGVRGGGVL